MASSPAIAGIDLYWLPLGAGGHSVRLNGRIFEAVVARLEKRGRCDLYHSALEVRVSEGRFVIEQGPAWSERAERGVVAEGAVGIVGEPQWAGDSLGDVRNAAVAPAPDLVAQEPKTAQGSHADRPFGDDAAFGGLAPCGRLLDHEPSLRHEDLQRRVVEVAATAVLQPGCKPLEHEAVQANGVAAGAEGQPVQVDAGDHERRIDAGGSVRRQRRR